MKIALHYQNNPPFQLGDHEARGIGGTENFACYVASALRDAGHTVSFYNFAELAEVVDLGGVKWGNVFLFDPRAEADVLVSFRMRDIFQLELAAKLKVLILADTESHGLGDDVRAGRIDVVMPVSQWQMNKIAEEEGLVGHPCWLPASNGVSRREYGLQIPEKRRGKCLFTSTPERGLDLLLDLWPRIEKSPILARESIQPELHLFSSFYGWGVTEEDNQKMAGHLYERIKQMQAEGLHVVSHKHAPRDILRQHQMESDVFLYASNFNETFCISLTECMAAGVIPVVSNRASLPERVQDTVNGYLVGKYMDDMYSGENRDLFVSKAVTALWIAPSVKQRIRELARATAFDYDYGKIVPKWTSEWEARIVQKEAAKGE